MKTNKFLIFALLLGSFALNAETTYYKRDGMTQITKEEYDNSFKSTKPRSNAVAVFEWNGLNCRSNGGYAQCEDDQPFMWVDFTSPAPEAKENIIGGDSRTWTPKKTGGNIGANPATWGPAIDKPTYQDSTGLLGRSSSTYAPTKNAIVG